MMTLDNQLGSPYPYCVAKNVHVAFKIEAYLTVDGKM